MFLNFIVHFPFILTIIIKKSYQNVARLYSGIERFYQLSSLFIGGHSGLLAFLAIYRQSFCFISFPSHLSVVTLLYQLSFPFIGGHSGLSAFLPIYRRSLCFIS
ncbi:hypothetical protein, partial [Oceanobacillus senegalensis]|uniref:hypothetical protein n=1 Tax=Oceanobacillus senegalensis TaxID=1936063 RepID=UPI001C4ECB7C